MFKRSGVFLGLVLLILALSRGPAGAVIEGREIPVKGMVTMVDIAGDSCVPCKMMIPIIREMEEKYRGRAAIITIDVGKNREQLKELNARVIPTQIFYDRDGREHYRHEGFLDKKSIIELFEKLGAGN